MNKLLEAIMQMNNLEDFAMGDTKIHRFHPLFKIIISLILLVLILSSNSLLELFFYWIIVVLIAKKANITFITLLKRGLLGLPFSLCIGISNLLLNHTTITYYGFTTTLGVVSCILILLKTFLCLSVTYVLIATTPFQELSSELVRMKVPSFFVLQLTMTYRYIFTFLEEAKTMVDAYLLRNPTAKGINMKDMGPFIGHLLVKSMVQSKRVYECMICRGFNVKRIYTQTRKINLEDLYISMMLIAILIIGKELL